MEKLNDKKYIHKKLTIKMMFEINPTLGEYIDFCVITLVRRFIGSAMD